jgi:hypothetical protein
MKTKKITFDLQKNKSLGSKEILERLKFFWNEKYKYIQNKFEKFDKSAYKLEIAQCNNEVCFRWITKNQVVDNKVVNTAKIVFEIPEDSFKNCEETTGFVSNDDISEEKTKEFKKEFKDEKDKIIFE